MKNDTPQYEVKDVADYELYAKKKKSWWRRFFDSNIPMCLLIGLLLANTWQDYGWWTILYAVIIGAIVGAFFWLLESWLERKYRRGKPTNNRS